jgi:GGDEF domain-containing protein
MASDPEAELAALQEEFEEFTVLAKETEDELTLRVAELERQHAKHQQELGTARGKAQELQASLGAALDEGAALTQANAALTADKQRLEVLCMKPIQK